MAQFAADTFTDTSGTALDSHTPDVGGPITKHPVSTGAGGAVAISNANRGRKSTANRGSYYYAGLPASADYTVGGVMRPIDTTNSSVGVAGRMNTVAETYYRAYFDRGSGLLQLEVAVSGTLTSLGSFSTTPATGSDNTVVLSMVGTAISVSLNGTTVISVTDSSIAAAGKAGVSTAFVAGSDSTGNHLDNFSADDVVAAFDPASGFPWPDQHRFHRRESFAAVGY